MTPVGQGRFCSSCNKVVVDFTNATEEKLNQLLTEKQGTICGRFQTHQVNKNFPNHNFKRAVFRKFKLAVVSAGAFFGFNMMTNEKAISQTIDFSNQYGRKSGIEISKLKFSDTTKIIIQGKLKDKTTLESIPFATILVKNGDQELGTAISDDDGNFKLEFERGNFPHVKADLIVSYLGYDPLKIENIPISNSATYLSLLMSGNTSWMGECIIGSLQVINPGETSTGSTLTRDEIRHLAK